MACQCSNEMKSCTSLTLKQKLEIIKLSEESMLKAEIGWKLGMSNCESQGKVLEGNWNTRMIRKWNSLIANIKF